MDVMELRRGLLMNMASGQGEKTITGTFTMETDDFFMPVDVGDWHNIKFMLLHMEDIDNLADLPAGCVIDILTILDPAYALSDYAQVHPYYSIGFAKNAAGTIISMLYSRSAYSTGPNYNDNGKWYFRANSANLYFKAGHTYRWTAYLK